MCLIDIEPAIEFTFKTPQDLMERIPKPPPAHESPPDGGNPAAPMAQ